MRTQNECKKWMTQVAKHREALRKLGVVVSEFMVEFDVANDMWPYIANDPDKLAVTHFTDCNFKLYTPLFDKLKIYIGSVMKALADQGKSVPSDVVVPALIKALGMDEDAIKIEVENRNKLKVILAGVERNDQQTSEA